MKLVLLVLTIVWSSNCGRPDVLVGQLSKMQLKQPIDDITDNYKEMLADPTKKLIQYDGISDKIDLSKNLVIDNSPLAKPFASGVVTNKIKSYTGQIAEEQAFEKDGLNANLLAKSYKEMLQHPGQKLVTLGIDENEIKDFHKNGYLDQKTEDPEFRQTNAEQEHEEGVGQIQQELCDQEPLLNYYDKHRFKIQKYLKKINEKKQLGDVEQKIFGELKEYQDNVKQRMDQLKHQPTYNKSQDDVMDGLNQIDNYIEVGLKGFHGNMDQNEQKADVPQDKVSKRLKKISKFMDSIKTNKMNEKQSKVFKEASSYLGDLKEAQLDSNQKVMVKGIKQKIDQIKQDQNSFRFSSVQNNRKYTVQQQEPEARQYQDDSEELLIKQKNELLDKVQGLDQQINLKKQSMKLKKDANEQQDQKKKLEDDQAKKEEEQKKKEEEEKKKIEKEANEYLSRISSSMQQVDTNSSQIATDLVHQMLYGEKETQERQLFNDILNYVQPYMLDPSMPSTPLIDSFRQLADLKIPMNKLSGVAWNEIKQYLKSKDQDSIDSKVTPVSKEIKGIKDTYVEKMMDNSKRFNKKDAQRFKNQSTQIEKKVKPKQKPVQPVLEQNNNFDDLENLLDDQLQSLGQLRSKSRKK